MQNYLKFVESGENYKESKKFKNCIHPTVFSTEDKLILDIVLPPELHLSLGVVNTVYDHMLKHNKADALKRASLCNVKRDMTHGSPEFNGNPCRILLKKVDSLMRDSLACLLFVEVLQNFKLVVDACFSTTLHANYSLQRVKIDVIAIEKSAITEVDKILLDQNLKPIPGMMYLHQIVLNSLNWNGLAIRHLSCNECLGQLECNHNQEKRVTFNFNSSNRIILVAKENYQEQMQSKRLRQLQHRCKLLKALKRFD